jgi:hypothetical protein
MCDFIGKELTIGDEVAYVSYCRTSANLCRGIVCGFTNQMVKVHDQVGRISLKSPYKVVKILK